MRDKLRDLIVLLSGGIFLFLSTGICGCDGSSNAAIPPNLPSDHAIRLELALEAVENVLVLNPDGTLAMDPADPDFVALDAADQSFGRAVIATANALVGEGLLQVNADFTADWLGPPRQCDQCPEGSDCHTHWYGEKCSVSTSTTRKICIGLESGEGALVICSFIPVVDVACEIIEAVGAIPLEAEICPCSDRHVGSNFKVTWIGAAWFSCS